MSTEREKKRLTDRLRADKWNFYLCLVYTFCIRITASQIRFFRFMKKLLSANVREVRDEMWQSETKRAIKKKKKRVITIIPFPVFKFISADMNRNRVQLNVCTWLTQKYNSELYDHLRYEMWNRNHSNELNRLVCGICVILSNTTNVYNLLAYIQILCLLLVWS